MCNTFMSDNISKYKRSYSILLVWNLWNMISLHNLKHLEENLWKFTYFSCDGGSLRKYTFPTLIITLATRSAIYVGRVFLSHLNRGIQLHECIKIVKI